MNMASGPRITIGSAVGNNVALTTTNSTTFTYSWSTPQVSAKVIQSPCYRNRSRRKYLCRVRPIKLTLDTTAPTVTLSDTDDDNFLAASDTVTITAFFDEAYDGYSNNFDSEYFHFESEFD